MFLMVREGDHALLGLASFCCTMVGSMKHRMSHTKGMCSDNGHVVGSHEDVHGGERVRTVGARGEGPGACIGPGGGWNIHKAMINKEAIPIQAAVQDNRGLFGV